MKVKAICAVYLEPGVRTAPVLHQLGCFNGMKSALEACSAEVHKVFRFRLDDVLAKFVMEGNLEEVFKDFIFKNEGDGTFIAKNECGLISQFSVELKGFKKYAVFSLFSDGEANK